MNRLYGVRTSNRTTVRESGTRKLMKGEKGEKKVKRFKPIESTNPRWIYQNQVSFDIFSVLCSICFRSISCSTKPSSRLECVNAPLLFEHHKKEPDKTLPKV